ncbi:MAG: thioredoxin 2 [Blastocatellia bacterium]|jgi:thioredoxin 2|nr:thioredoxin 2 [Blastocatellia bacterium]
MENSKLVACAKCGATNRISAERVEGGHEPVCGRCKAPLYVAAASGPVTVTDSTFAAEVERSPVPVLVDMWAPWCGPCRMIAPMLEELAMEMASRLRIAKVNIDDNPATAARFAVRSIPTLLVMKDGKEIDRMVGVMPKVELKARLERLLPRGATANG